MEQLLQNKLKELDITYEPIKNQEHLKLVYDLFVNNIYPKEIPDDCHVYNFIGLYHNERKNYTKAVNYFLLGVSKNSVDAMYNLGAYYEEQKDTENMLKYYLMASEHGDSDAMNNLGYYYKEQKDTENMFKYFLMACEKNEQTSIQNINWIFHDGYYPEYANDFKDFLDEENKIKYGLYLETELDDNQDCAHFVISI